MINILRSHTPIVSSFLDALFPLHCVCCENHLQEERNTLKQPQSNNPFEKQLLVKLYLENRLFCKNCLEKIGSYRCYLEKILCEHCGSPKNLSKCPCEEKIRSLKIKTRLRSIFTYSEDIRKLIFLIKFNPSVDLCNWVSLLLFSNLALLFQSAEGPNLTTWDSISFVPSKFDNILKRGGYSTYLICSSLSRLLGDLPVLVVESSSSLRQSSLKFNERIKRQARFTLKPNLNNTKQISTPKATLLIDDMLTTGSTAHEVAGVLMDYGIKRVDILTLARAIDFRKNYLRYITRIINEG